MLFAALAGLFLIAVSVHQVGFMMRRRQMRKRDWTEIVSSLEAINFEGITAIANMFLNPTKDQLRLEPSVMWEMLGGIAGLNRLCENADAMLELCVYAESWDYQGPVISEMIRLDMANLKKAVQRVQLSRLYGLGQVRSHFALMEAAAHYNLICRRLLGQYEKAHVGRLPILQARLGA